MTSSQPSPNKPYTAGRREMYAWGIGGLANHALICTFGQVTNIFTMGFGLSPILVSWAMTLPRAIDAVIDPALGHLSDNTHTRWGRRKPFLVIGAVLAALFLSLIWWANRDWSPMAQFAYLLVCATLFYSSWGLYSMAWTAIGYELTDDYHERSRVQGIAGIFLTLVLVGNSWIYWMALRPIFGNEVNGIRWIAGTIAVVSLLAAIICVWSTNERFGKANPVRNHVALLPAIRATLSNRPFVILLLQRMCGILGGRVCGGLGGLLSVYYVCGGDKSLAMKVAGITGTLAMVWGLALMPFMRYFSRMIGKRRAMVAGAGLGFAGTLIAPLVTIPGHP